MIILLSSWQLLREWPSRRESSVQQGFLVPGTVRTPGVEILFFRHIHPGKNISHVLELRWRLYYVLVIPVVICLLR